MIGRLGVTDDAVVFVPSRWARAVAALGSPYRPDWKEVSLDPIVIARRNLTKVDLASPPGLTGMMPGQPGAIHLALTGQDDEFFLPRGQNRLDDALRVLRGAVGVGGRGAGP